jgi:hypothetical protein
MFRAERGGPREYSATRFLHVDYPVRRAAAVRSAACAAAGIDLSSDEWTSLGRLGMRGRGAVEVDPCLESRSSPLLTDALKSEPART